jgi:MYND finger
LTRLPVSFGVVDPSFRCDVPNNLVCETTCSTFIRIPDRQTTMSIDPTRQTTMSTDQTYVVPPCTHCKKPTGNFCDGVLCERRNQVNGSAMNAICDECERQHGLCTMCQFFKSTRRTCEDPFHLSVVKGGTNTCARCLMPGCTRKCSACHIAHYCNVTCQKLDWKRHKKLTCVVHHPDRNNRNDPTIIQMYPVNSYK